MELGDTEQTPVVSGKAYLFIYFSWQEWCSQEYSPFNNLVYYMFVLWGFLNFLFHNKNYFNNRNEGQS